MSLSNPAQPIHNYIKAMLMAVAATAELGVDFGVGRRQSAARVARARSGDASGRRRAARCGDRRRAPLFYAAGHRHHQPAHRRRHGLRAPARRDALRSDLLRSLFGVRHGSAARHPDLPGKLRRAAERRGWLVLNYHDLPDENSLLYHSLQRIFGTVLFASPPAAT